MMQSVYSTAPADSAGEREKKVWKLILVSLILTECPLFQALCLVKVNIYDLSTYINKKIESINFLIILPVEIEIEKQKVREMKLILVSSE